MSLNISFIILFFILTSAVSFTIFLKRRRRQKPTEADIYAPIIFDMLEEAIIAINASNVIEYLNSKAEQLLNSSRNDILGKNISEIFSDIDIRKLSDLKKAEVRTSDGIKISVLLSSAKLLDKDRNLKGHTLILEQADIKDEYENQVQEKIKESSDKDDILEKMRQKLENNKLDIEQEVTESTRNLLEAHARLFTSINNLSLGFIMTDKDKNIIMTNKAIKTMLPVTEGKILLADLQKNIREEINIIKSVDESLTKRASLSYLDIQIKNKFVNLFISPVIVRHNDISETIGAVILIEDKTEERLIKRSKENFFIIASHELRTPLTGIKGYIAIIKQLYFDKIKNDDLKRIINDIDTSSSRLINIVNDFLNTSKVELDKNMLQVQPCDLIPIINSSIKETSSIAIEKKLFINFKPPPFTTAMVLGDKDKIKQILINLISNSTKYSDKGGITLNLEKTPDNQYKVYVIDSGRGIKQENVKFLFSKFQQIDTFKRNVISSGLGLYISKILTDKMHGNIKLESTEEGKGTTFSFSLPVYNI